MADNVAITAGAGTTIHADEYTHSTLGSGKTQLVKLVDGTLDASTAIAAGGGTEASALRVTLANDSTGLVSVDDNGGSLTVDAATLTTIAGAVSGTEMQVDIVAALPAGTNAIGKLAANSGVDIGDVDVTSCALPTGASTSALQSTIDASINTLLKPASTLTAVTTVGTVSAVTAITNALPAGTNNIGDVDVLTLPALAAGTNLIGRVSSSNETSTIYNGTTAVTPAFAVIDHAVSGDNTIVAADVTKKIRVFSLFLISAGTVNVRFEGGAGGTALTGQMNLIANTGFVLPYNPLGWFETAANTLLNLELSAAISVDGSITYGLI